MTQETFSYLVTLMWLLGFGTFVIMFQISRGRSFLSKDPTTIFAVAFSSITGMIIGCVVSRIMIVGFLYVFDVDVTEDNRLFIFILVLVGAFLGSLICSMIAEFMSVKWERTRSVNEG